jgi:hypothetical protein
MADISSIPSNPHISPDILLHRRRPVSPPTTEEEVALFKRLHERATDGLEAELHEAIRVQYEQDAKAEADLLQAETDTLAALELHEPPPLSTLALTGASLSATWDVQAVSLTLTRPVTPHTVLSPMAKAKIIVPVQHDERAAAVEAAIAHVNAKTDKAWLTPRNARLMEYIGQPPEISRVTPRLEERFLSERTIQYTIKYGRSTLFEGADGQPGSFKRFVLDNVVVVVAWDAKHHQYTRIGTPCLPRSISLLVYASVDSICTYS